jgi:hypothetical protein
MQEVKVEGKKEKTYTIYVNRDRVGEVNSEFTHLAMRKAIEQVIPMIWIKEEI